MATWKQIETSREIRLWISQIVMPVATFAAAAATEQTFLTGTRLCNTDRVLFAPAVTARKPADGTIQGKEEKPWHMAVMCILLQEYSNEKIDLLKTISMILIHDVVERDAGDTYAYDDEGKKTQREREVKAAERIFGVLPDDQKDKFSALWDEFEAGETPEAKFAHTMDNFQPAMLNNATDGKMWKSHKVKLQQILERNSNSADGSGHDS